MNIANYVKELNIELADLSVKDRLRLISERFARPVFLSAMQPEDQYVTWVLAFQKLSIRIVQDASSGLGIKSKNLILLTNERYGLAIRSEKNIKQSVLGPSDVVISAFAGGGNDDRANTFAQWDDQHRIMRINLLSDWTEKQINDELSAHEIPVDRTINRIKTEISENKANSEAAVATISAYRSEPSLATSSAI